MSTEYTIVAEKDDDVVLFDHLYKMKGTMLAIASNWTVEEAVENYFSEIEKGWAKPEDKDREIRLLFHLLRFIADHEGYTFRLLDDNNLIDYMLDKDPEWTWRTSKYYEPRH